MSFKSTIDISRDKALLLLMSEIPRLSSGTLGELLDKVAESQECERLSYLNNFVVRDTARTASAEADLQSRDMGLLKVVHDLVEKKFVVIDNENAGATEADVAAWVAHNLIAQKVDARGTEPQKYEGENPCR